MNNENVQVYEEKFDKPVLIDSTYYYDNQVVELGLSIYKDYYPQAGRYGFSSPNSKNSNLMDLGACPSRTREQILFELDDVDKFLDMKIEQWKSRESFNFKNSWLDVTSTKDGIYGMKISTRAGMYLEIIPCKIDSGKSYRNPHRLIRLDRYHSEIATSRDIEALKSEIHQFTPEGIQALKSEFKDYLVNTMNYFS